MSARFIGPLMVFLAGCLMADTTSNDDLTPGLVEAINARNPERVLQLLEAGVPATSISADGDTPLCAALRTGQTGVAAILLEQGADANAWGMDHQPPLSLASLRRCPAVVKLLLESGANPNTPLSLSPVLLTPDVIPDDPLRSFLKRERKITPLMACVVRGDVESSLLLLKAGANLEARTSPKGFVALDFAAMQGFNYMMRVLLGRDPESEPKVVVHVNLSRQQAILQIEGRPAMSTIISTGRQGYATPVGRYVVTQKYRQWNSTIYKVAMPFFMRLNCGNIGLHSGYVTGAPASHGCIRLPEEVARKFYDLVSTGDEVVIER